MDSQHPDQRSLARFRAALLRGGEITQLPDVEPLIEGVFDFDSIAVLHGKYGSGKSFIALDWACCVATGKDWWGHKVKQGKVLYVVGEGAAGVGPRYTAWQKYHGERDVGDNLVWLTTPPNLLDPGQREAFLEIVGEETPDLTILDTLARHLPGGDENTSQTMSAMVETLDGIRRLTSGLALTIHHPGKNDENGSRGHSSLPGALDTEIACATSREGEVHKMVLTAEKQKNHPDGHVIASLRLELFGESCVVVPEETPNPMVAKIVDYLQDHPGANKRSLRELGDSNTVDRELDKLVKAGRVRRNISGTTHLHYLT